jgi:hypothetical protein
MSQVNGSRALLYELHAHTTWSDGELTLRSTGCSSYPGSS